MSPLSQSKQVNNHSIDRKERTFGLLENKGSFLIKENFSMSDEALLKKHVDIDQGVFKAKEEKNNEHHIRSRKLPPFRQIPRY